MKPTYLNKCVTKEYISIESAYATAPFILKLYTYIFVPAFLLLGTYFLISSKDVLTFIVFLIGAVLVVGIGFYIPKRNGIISYNKELDLYGEEVILINSFYENSLSTYHTQADIYIDLNYVDIKKIVETKHLYVLLSNKANAVLVYKDGFEPNNSDSFLTFIKSKSINSKHIKK